MKKRLKYLPSVVIAGLACAVLAIALALLLNRKASRQGTESASSHSMTQDVKPDAEGPNSVQPLALDAPEEGPRLVTPHAAKHEHRPVAQDDHRGGPAFSITVRNHDRKPDPLAALDLQPRKPHPPKPLHVPAGNQLRMTVKFMDWAMARMEGDDRIEVSDASSDEVEQLVMLAREHGLDFNRAFDRPEQLDALRLKAARRSGQMQPDLNGTMTINLQNPAEALTIAQAVQAMGMIEAVDIESLDLPPPPPSDIPPTTPSLDSLQGYLGTNPGFGVNFLKALGVSGEGIRFSDCEYGYNPDHEDLMDASLTDASRADINPDVYSNNWDEHGTAVWGVILAGDNGYGVTGIAPECDGYFYSEWTTLGYDRALAVSDAVLASSEGDVVLLEMQTTSGNGSQSYAPAEYNSSIWNLTKTATDAGIIVVAAAGNGNQNLDDSFYTSYMNRGDSGAIIVGSGTPNTTHSKRSSSTYGSRVDVQAWGSNVMTTGYGVYATYGGDDNQSYTSGFNGTSSASACVAGAVVLLQSYAKNKLDTLFTPEEMRAHLKTYGHPQGGSGGNIGRAIALDLAVAELPDRPLQIALTSPNGEDISLMFWGLPFRTHSIESSENLSQWNDLRTGLPGSANALEELLIGELNSYPARFYRISEE